MKRCKHCYMPDTRPNTLFKDGVCGACHSKDKQTQVDWNKRGNTFEEICSKYRHENHEYDCIIPVSGGKNSHFQVMMVKRRGYLNPLLVTVNDPFTKTQAGLHNIQNLGRTFDCDHIIYNINPNTFKKATRIGFEQLGEPLKYIETLIYTFPYKLACEMNISSVFYGESPFTMGSDDETMWVNDYIYHLVDIFDIDWWKQQGLHERDLYGLILPDKEFTNPKCYFMSYFFMWDNYLHYEIAKQHGFKDLWGEWHREGYIEHYEQIDSIGYLVHLWLKYPKFGYQRVSDIVGKRIRDGYMTYECGKDLVDSNDHKLDQRTLEDFCQTLGYTIEEFWNITDKHYNTDLFKKDDYGVWRLKE